MKKDPRTLIHTPADLATEHLAWAKRNVEEQGIPWGIPSVDRHVIPMRPGDLVGLIGRPGHGKSSLMAYLARTQAKRIMARGTADKEAVVYVTWESSAEEIENFFIADDKMSASDIAWGRADIEEIKRRAVKRARVPIWVIGHGIGRASPNTPRMTVDVVYQAIESMQEDYGIRPVLVLLDYMQLIPVMKSESRVERVTDAVIRAKELAQRAAVPVVAGVQARRDVDKYKQPIPEKSDAQWACLAGDVKIANSENGFYITAKDLWETMRERGSFPVYAMDVDTFKIKTAHIVEAKRNPSEQIYKLSCSDGSTIRANSRHKFYTQHGWSELSELRVGDWIAVAKRLPVTCKSSELTEREAYVLGLLLGDGTIVRSAVLSNSDWEILHSFKNAVESEWPDYTVRFRKQTNWDVWDATIVRVDGRVFPNCNETLLWLKRIGVFGKTAAEKYVPRLSFDDAAAAELLSGLFTTDGSVFVDNDGHLSLGFSGCSRMLVNDVRRLLLRFGISSYMRQQRRHGTRKPINQLHVSVMDAHTFAEYIKIRGRKGYILNDFLSRNKIPFGRSMGDLLPPAWNLASVDILKQHHLRSRFNNVKGRAITRGRMRQIANATQNETLAMYADCDLSWRRVTGIEPDGFEHTYDFYVPGLNNFVANNFIVHNSGVEQTVDKLFGLWRPILSPGFENMAIEIEGINGTLVVNDKLLIMRMLKQRFEDGRRTWALYFAPQYLKLAEMELAYEQSGGY